MNNITLHSLKYLIISNGFWDFTRYMFRIFMSLYLWTLTEDLRTIAIFEITWLAAHLTVFTIAAPLAKKNYSRQIRQVGMVGMLVTMGIMLWLQNAVIDNLLLLGTLYGVFNGLYWLGYHVFSLDFTNTKNRGNFTGITQALRITAALIGPVVLGYLIANDSLNIGYGWTFILGMVSLLFALYFSNTSSSVKTKQEFHIRETLQHVRKNKDVQRILISNFFANVGQNGAIRRLIPMFLFAVLMNEFHVGGWITFFTTLSILTTYALGKKLSYNMYKQSNMTAGSILSISLLLLITSPGLLVYIIYGSLKELLAPVVALARRVHYFNLLHTLPDYQTHRVEYLLVREWCNLIGRIISFSPLLFIQNFDSPFMIFLLLLMVFATFLDSYFIYTIKTDISKV